MSTGIMYAGSEGDYTATRGGMSVRVRRAGWRWIGVYRTPPPGGVGVRGYEGCGPYRTRLEAAEAALSAAERMDRMAHREQPAVESAHPLGDGPGPSW